LQSADILGSSAISNGSATESGIALGYKFFGKKEALRVASSMAAETELKIINTLSIFLGVEIEYSVQYPTSFSPTITEVESQISLLKTVIDTTNNDNIKNMLTQDILDIVSNFMNYDDEKRSKLLSELKLIV
jgi:excinuclease UvrABC ATPase subunit